MKHKSRDIIVVVKLIKLSVHLSQNKIFSAEAVQNAPDIQ